MSRGVSVQFEVRDILIMKDTLKEMGHNFSEVGENQIEIRRPYHNIVINGNKISYDEEDKKMTNKIKQEYMVNFYHDRVIKEGMNVDSVEVQENGEIHVILGQ